MVRFTTRVVLQDADDADYETLHSMMALQGFSRTIKDDDTGIWYHLPPAEYDIEDPSDLLNQDTVIGRATIAADIVGRKYGVLVSPTYKRRWVGLEAITMMPSSADLLALRLPTLNESFKAAIVGTVASKYNPYDNL